MKSLARLLFIGMLAAALALALASGAGAQGNAVTVTLAGQNNSSLSGTATLTPTGDQTQVVIKVTGEPTGASEPAHVHEGTCANLNPVPKYPLANVVNGSSTTTINVPLASLTSGQFAINLHKSAQELTVYVACGDITATPAAAPATGGGGLAQSGRSAPALAVILAAGLLGVGWFGRRRAA
jgi:hypothetical protein